MSRRDRSVYVFIAGVVAIVVGMLGLAALQYFIPESSHYSGPIDVYAARHGALWLFGHVPGSISVRAFTETFRVLVAIVWLGYAAAIVSAFRMQRPPANRVLLTAGLLAAALAVLFPPSLTHDLYAYLAYGRMAALHGWNPYIHTLSEFALFGDAAARQYSVDASSVYGPVWTLLCAALATAVAALPLAAQVVSFKLVAAAALVCAALCARVIARVWDPEHADLALIAVALNPLLLLEGPGSGHNDVLMMALLLAGIALVVRRSWIGWPVIGLSVGIKFITIAIVPWLIFRYVRTMPRRTALLWAAAALGLVMAPILVAFVPFLGGGDVFRGIGTVWSAKASGHPGASLGLLVCVGMYVATSVWLLRGREDDRVAAAWTMWAMTAALLLTPILLPWYLSWPTALTLTRWDRRQRWLTASCFVVGAWFAVRYTILR